jgi:hypothetical protein
MNLAGRIFLNNDKNRLGHCYIKSNLHEEPVQSDRLRADARVLLSSHCYADEERTLHELCIFAWH